MKILTGALLVAGLALLVGMAHAGEGKPGHAHAPKKEAAKTGGHRDAAPHGHAPGMAMMTHGDAQHMKDMEMFRQTMSENFGGLMGIMTGLIYDRKDAVKDGAAILVRHSDHIADLKPPKNAERIEQYKYYAFQLKEHSKHVMQAVDLTHGEMVYGYPLGEVVDACVSCHTHFRPRIQAK